MAKKIVEGVWVAECDVCHKQYVDPDGGKDADKDFQCGAHHGIIAQKDKPEFQVPEGEEQKENLDVIKAPEVMKDE